MIRKVLVPLDLSPFGEHALPLAAEIARRADAEVRLVHIFEGFSDYPNWIDSSGEIDQALRRNVEAYLDKTAARVHDRTGTRVSKVVIVAGDPAKDIPAEAAASGSGLIVMSTHGRSGISRAWLGSVADQLVRSSEVPLLLDRPKEGEPDFAAPTQLRRWLVPLDGSELSQGILDPVLNLAKLFDAEVILMRVVEPVYPGTGVLAEVPMAPGSGPLHDMVDQMYKVEQQAAAEYLDRVAADLKAKGAAVRAVVKTDDTPHEAILKVASEQADAIALATRGWGGAMRWLLGSVADKVIRGSDKPVLVYQPS